MNLRILTLAQHEAELFECGCDRSWERQGVLLRFKLKLTGEKRGQMKIHPMSAS